MISYKRIFSILIIFNISVFPQLPAASEIAGQMKVGWNLGNTLEAICSETAWGNPLTTQELIDSVKEAGYNALRLPCAWDCHAVNGIINNQWLERVKEVVDYCINNDLYVILNVHWDGGWLENNVSNSAKDSVNAKQKNYWTQIANFFKDYDEHLLFAGANEPNVNSSSGMPILLSYHQTFIDAVRATGGNNSTRTLVIQGPSTDIEKTNNWMNVLPIDSVENRLMVEVHYYTPWQFCGLTQDENWGKMFYYWGKDYHSSTDSARNATWGEEDVLDDLMETMKVKFVDKGIPVILGEYGAIKRTLAGNSEQQLHLDSRQYFYSYLVESAIKKGIIPFNWDTGPYGDNTWGIFDRNTGATIDHGLLDAIMKAAEKGASTSVTDKSYIIRENDIYLEQNYPNPFNPSTTISWFSAVDGFVSLKIYDLLGREIKTLVHEEKSSGYYKIHFNDANIAAGVYFYFLRINNDLHNTNFSDAKRMMLIK